VWTMPAPRDPFDLRRAGEDVLLDALRAGHPLALAEAYHRTVPAAHAVARRLVAGADQVEDLLHDVYASLWADPPAAGPLEGWVRRATWAAGVERLRATGTAPVSPSAAGLVPDLPAPDVRFLDAAERAIAELPDEQRRALLLAHDKGVPSAGQEPGADQALLQALLALAGPETSGGDRDAVEADGCADVVAMGDWSLGVAGRREHAEVDRAVEDRPGCAAVARAVRRGRRRVEGLPATPDMGQRILVSVLTTSPAPAAPAAAGAAGAHGGADEPVVVVTAAPGGDAGPVDVPHDEPTAEDLGSEDGAVEDGAVEDGLPGGDGAATTGLPEDPVALTGPMPPVGVGPDVDPEAAVADGPADVDDPFAPPRDDDAAVAPDPFGDPDEPAGTSSDLVGDTADLQRADDAAADAAAADAADADPSTGPEGADAAAMDPFGEADAAADEQPFEQDWRPDPGSTAELRLSDILAEGDDDDPFAGLEDDDDDAAARPPARPGDPYAALRDLEGEPGAGATTRPATTGPVGRIGGETDDGDLVGGYVEGQEDLQPLTGPPGSGRMAAVLAWLLPIIGGSALGVLIAILVFGPPT
jgi:DNA-directed RNA polymerase specialized sigma24 family protein